MATTEYCTEHQNFGALYRLPEEQEEEEENNEGQEEEEEHNEELEDEEEEVWRECRAAVWSNP